MVDQQDYRELARMVAYEQAKLSTSAWFFAGEDHLRVRSFGSLASVVLAIEGRFLRADGEIVAFAERHVPTSDRTEATSTHTLGQGFLLNLSVRASSGTPRVGQVFVTVEVVRGFTGAVQILGALVAGYVTDTQRLAWPGTPTQHSTDGPGVIRSITGTNPAIGVEISETVPTNARWRLISLHVRFGTDANVANRSPILVIDDGAATVWTCDPPSVQAASLDYAYVSGDGLARVDSTIDTKYWSGVGSMMLQGGYRIRTNTVLLAGGDNWAAPELLVAEWIED